MSSKFSNLKRRGVDIDEFQKLPAGAYVCKLRDVRIDEVAGRDQMVCDVEIVEGEFAGFFEKHSNKNYGWNKNATFKRYITEQGTDYLSNAFEKFVVFLEKNNPSFQFDPDYLNAPEKFRDLLCGFTFREEEFPARDTGEIKVAVKIYFPCKVQDVREGKIKTPPIQREKRKNSSADDYDKEFIPDGSEIPDSSVPF